MKIMQKLTTKLISAIGSGCKSGLGSCVGLGLGRVLGEGLGQFVIGQAWIRIQQTKTRPIKARLPKKLQKWPQDAVTY